jgi:hypothetical protein
MTMPCPRVRPDVLVDEIEIVWLEDVDGLDYVREAVYPLRTRSRRPSWHLHAGRVVGYATLRPGARRAWPGDFYERRVFWLNDHDRDRRPDGVYRTGTPVEAVDPRTVFPGVPGRLTERARYGAGAGDEPAPIIGCGAVGEMAVLDLRPVVVGALGGRRRAPGRAA